MNPTAIKVIRWTLLLPAAFAVAFIAQVVASLEHFFLARWIVDLQIKFFMGMGFVVGGAFVAPTLRPWPAIVLLSLQVISAGCGIANTWIDGTGNRWWETLLFLSVIFGASLGFCQARAYANDQN